MDDKTLLASSGEGTVQSFDLRYNKPDIQSEVSGKSNYRPVGGHDDTYVGEHQITRLVDYHLERLIPATFLNKLDRFMSFIHYGKKKSRIRKPQCTKMVFKRVCFRSTIVS